MRNARDDLFKNIEADKTAKKKIEEDKGRIGRVLIAASTDWKRNVTLENQIYENFDQSNDVAILVKMLDFASNDLLSASANHYWFAASHVFPYLQSCRCSTGMTGVSRSGD